MKANRLFITLLLILTLPGFAANAFTEQGVAMLSGVLHSDRAIKVNIQIMRVFTRMRKLLEAHKEILKKLDHLERREIEWATKEWTNTNSE